MLISKYIFINFFLYFGSDVVYGVDTADYGVLANCNFLDTYSFSYTDFFEIIDREINDHKDLGTATQLEFHVKAESNAHILLSTVKFPSDLEPVYEIVLGAGDNTFSEIRRLQRAESKATVKTENLLSAEKWRSFWIRITSEGLLEIGKRGEELPFMFWQDPEPLYVRYFSFSTWVNIFGLWAYNCHSEKTGTESSNDIEPKVDLIAPTEELKHDLFLNYDPFTTPFYAIQFKTQIRIICWHIDLNANTGILHLYGVASLAWSDDRLMWEPSLYGGQTLLHAGNFLTWRPEIVLMNGVFANQNPFGMGNTILQADGTVTWASSLKMQTRCHVNLKNWPWDSHKCQIQFVIYTPEASITPQKQYGMPAIECPERTSTWVVTNTEIFSTNFSHGDGSLRETLTIEITLQRNVSLFQFALCFTFIAIGFMTLSSFWISPLSSIKTLTNTLSLLLASVFLLVLVNSVPEFTSKTPNLYIAYLLLYFIIGIANCFSICLIYITRKLHINPPPQVLLSCINKRFLQLVLFLPLDKQQSINYDQLKEKYEEIADVENSQRGTKSIRISQIKAIQNDWLRIATAIDHFLFIIYSLCMVLLIVNFVAR